MTGTFLIAVLLALFSAALLFLVVGERGTLLLPSTFRFPKELRFRHFFDLSGIHGYLYGRWPSRYLKILREQILPRLGARGKRRLADRYHGKVLTADHAKAIISVNRKIPPQDIEQIIPYKAARNIVIDGPPDIIAFDCPCRQSRQDHVPSILPSGYVAGIDREKCSTCGTCADHCPFDALTVTHESVQMSWEKCMGCGVFVSQCPNEARSLDRDERKGVPLDVRLLDATPPTVPET